MRRLFLLLFAYKSLYLLTVSAALLVWPEHQNEPMFHARRQAFLSDGKMTFDSHFGSWDAEHYLSLIAYGYQTGAARCAFYPLFPFTVRGFAALTGISQLLSGMILSNAFALAGWCVFFVLVRKRFGESAAQLALVFLIAFPGSLFFQFIYTESLFFLLLMLLLWGLEESCLWLAWLGAFLLPLTRAVGIFCIIPVLFHFLFKRPPTWVKSLRIGSFLSRRDDEGSGSPKNVKPVFAWLLLAPLYGWAAYLLIMQRTTGNAFEGFEAQKQWGVQSFGNLFNVRHFVAALATPTSFHEFSGSAVDRCFFMLVLYSLPIVYRLDKSWLLWSVFLGIVPAMTGTFVSFTRFASVVFPLFVALAVFFDRPGRALRFGRLLVLAVFFTLQIILVWRFVNYRWAG